METEYLRNEKKLTHHTLSDMRAEPPGEMNDVMAGAVMNGVTLKEIHSVPDALMDGVYAHAYAFYERGELDQAEKFFSFLCMYDSSNADYFKGLGAVSQLKKNYFKASDLYALAFLLGDGDYHAVYLSGQCHLLAGHIVKALQSFTLVVENSQDETLISKAEIYLEMIKSERGNKNAGREKEE